jgi:hypothetical protein
MYYESSSSYFEFFYVSQNYCGNLMCVKGVKFIFAEIWPIRFKFLFLQLVVLKVNYQRTLATYWY